MKSTRLCGMLVALIFAMTCSVLYAAPPDTPIPKNEKAFVFKVSIAQPVTVINSEACRDVGMVPVYISDKISRHIYTLKKNSHADPAEASYTILCLQLPERPNAPHYGYYNRSVLNMPHSVIRPPTNLLE